MFNNLSSTPGKNRPINRAACSSDIFFRYRIKFTSGMTKYSANTTALPASNATNITRLTAEENHEKYSNVFMAR